MDAVSCLAPSFADTVIARALHFSSTTTMSMSPDSSASSSNSYLSHHHHQSHSQLLSAFTDLPSPCPYYASPPVPPHAVAATCCDSVLVADSSPPGRQTHPHPHPHPHALAPAGARARKRRSRASKRAPTTYISTDAANFRLMVQQITGVQADLAGVEMAMLHQVQALDAAALLGASAAAGNGNGNLQLLPAADDASALRQHQLHLELQQQQQQPCFPTLDSWNVMYETNSAEML